MTAEPIYEAAGSVAEPTPRWPVPPVDGWTVDDLFTWRAEQNGPGDRPVVHVYELDPVTGTSVHAGIHRDRIKVDVPCPIEST